MTYLLTVVASTCGRVSEEYSGDMFEVGRSDAEIWVVKVVDVEVLCKSLTGIEGT